MFCAVAGANDELKVSNSRSVSFVNDVVPVLTRSGCNAGVCHAKAGGGQNGFELSLLGFEPSEDYQEVVLEGRGRRLFLADPQQSLLLQKATGAVPHRGGARLNEQSESYHDILKWIEEGAVAPSKSDAELVKVSVEPASGVLLPNSSQQLNLVATYSDGFRRDVTSRALFESNDTAMATVTEDGLVSTLDIPGKASIMVRYQGQVAVFNAAIPLGAPLGEFPPVNNFVDELVFANLREIGIPPSPVCDDATFLRRISLDIAGRVPSAGEVEDFFGDKSETKRSAAIERLLRSPGYADYFANKWATVLKNRRDDSSDITANFAFHAWLRDSLLANVPYDQLVRELLAATGTIVQNPPVAWYKRVKEPKDQIEDVAQLFLGVRMQCAQCHHHPFERWSQDDYYGLAAFFSQVGRKPTDTAGEDLIFHERGLAKATNPRSKQAITPMALGDQVGAIPPGEDPRLRLANWMASKSNPFFARALANRYWKHFFRRGLIEPEDDIRDTNPPTNPKLLTALEQHFCDSGFDLKELVRVIANSATYQLSSVPNESNSVDRQNYSRFYPKRLQAEVLLDAIDQLSGASTTFANLPTGTRAVALPDNSYNTASPFLKVFGRPEATSVCECERVQSGSLAQSLHMMNAKDIKSKLSVSSGRAAELAKSNQSPDEMVSTIYLAAFGRLPRAEELTIARDYLAFVPLDKSGQPVAAANAMQANLQDLIWALINTKEFVFNH